MSQSTVGAFTLGRDGNAIVTAPTGQNVPIPLWTEFTWRPVYQTASVKIINAPTVNVPVPSHYEMEIMLDRYDAEVDKIFTDMFSGFFNIGTFPGSAGATGSVILTINEQNGGGSSTYQFMGCAMEQRAGGKLRQEGPVPQEIQVYAQRLFIT